MESTFENSGAEYGNRKQRLQDSSSPELKSFVSDVEDVVKRVANVSDAEVAHVRAKVQRALSSARSSVYDTAENVKEQAIQAARYADNYVRERPWQAIGIGAAVAAALGLTIGLMAARRR